MQTGPYVGFFCQGGKRAEGPYIFKYEATFILPYIVKVKIPSLIFSGGGATAPAAPPPSVYGPECKPSHLKCFNKIDFDRFYREGANCFDKDFIVFLPTKLRSLTRLVRPLEHLVTTVLLSFFRLPTLKTFFSWRR